MFLSNKFNFELGAEGNNGGVDTLVDPVIPDNVLKELEELRSFKANMASVEPTRTPEELAKEAELEKVNFRKFAIESDYMKDEDFSKLESLKSQKDRDLIFEDFSKEWEVENPDVDPEYKESMIKEDFESLYHLNSDNKVLKLKGEKLLAKEATEKRSPLENNYKKAQDGYGEAKSVYATVPKFNKFIDEVIKKNVPDKLTLFKTKEGEQELEVDGELTKEQKEEIDSMFRKNIKIFEKFKSGKDIDNVEASISKKIQGYIKINTYESANQKSFQLGKELGEGLGTNNGSTIGAKQPYAVVKGISKASVEEAKNSKDNVLADDIAFREKMKHRR
jgi:hypothetical protein